MVCTALQVLHGSLSRQLGFDPGVFGRFDLAALVQPHLQFLFVYLFVFSGTPSGMFWGLHNARCMPLPVHLAAAGRSVVMHVTDMGSQWPLLHVCEGASVCAGGLAGALVTQLDAFR